MSNSKPGQFDIAIEYFIYPNFIVIVEKHDPAQGLFVKGCYLELRGPPGFAIGKPE